MAAKLLTLRLGTNDVARARAFYDATFGILGIQPAPVPDQYPVAMYKLPDGLTFMLGAARDGNPATHANGGTIVFGADSEAQVSAWHAAGLANGGTCEGPPEHKSVAQGAFGAYMRDPDGNKLAAYCNLKLG
jgi:catechol 2,3-dioxygenase-like lactoylglutathione lyase family enzyme